MRAFAILLVIAYHARSAATPDSFAAKTFHNFLEAGWIGVDLFFVLSGFLITGILFDSVERKDFLRRFYFRRTLRIFPIYFLALALFPIVFSIVGMPEHARPVGFPYWVFLQNWLPFVHAPPDTRFAHFWSLGVEEQFYILWPLVFMVIYRRKWALHAFAGLIGVSIFFRILIVHYNTYSAGYFSTISHVDGLIAGATLAYAFRNNFDRARLRHICSMIMTAMPVSLVTVLIIANGFTMHHEIVLVYGILSLSIFLACIVALSILVPEESRPRRLLRMEWLRFIGRISYGIYVYHWPLTLILMRYWPANDAGYWMNQSMFFAVVLGGSVYTAWLSYLFIERPILNARERFAPSGAILRPAVHTDTGAETR